MGQQRRSIDGLRLRPSGEKALEKLRTLGCERRTLGGLFALLAAPPIINLESGTIIHTAPLDERDDETQLTRLDALAKLAQRVDRDFRRLGANLRLLSKTPSFRRFADSGLFDPLDEFGGWAGIVSRGSEFAALSETLSAFSREARKFGPRRRPDFNRRLRAVYTHIHHCTCKWHDELVADILADLIDGTWNAESLSSFRRRNDLVDSAGRREKRKS